MRALSAVVLATLVGLSARGLFLYAHAHDHRRGTS